LVIAALAAVPAWYGIRAFFWLVAAIGHVLIGVFG
jgi:hypothetical protein